MHAPNGYPQVAPIAFDVAEGDTEVPLALTLPGSGFVVAVVESESGEPLDELQVRARSMASNADRARRVAAEGVEEFPALPMGHGRYRIGPLVAGAYQLVLADGVHAPISDGALPGTQVRVRESAVTESHIVLPRGGSIEGQVVDLEQAPVADVWVSVTADRPGDSGSPRSSQLKRVLSDSEGRFVLAGLSPDARFRVVVDEPLGRGVVRRGVLSGDHLVIELPETVTLSGVALDPHGQPVPRFKAFVRHLEVGTRRAAVFEENQGRFLLRNLPPGRVRLSFLSDDGYRASRILTLAPGEQLEGLAVQLEPAGLVTQAIGTR